MSERNPPVLFSFLFPFSLPNICRLVIRQGHIRIQVPIQSIPHPPLVFQHVPVQLTIQIQTRGRTSVPTSSGSTSTSRCGSIVGLRRTSRMTVIVMNPGNVASTSSNGPEPAPRDVYGSLETSWRMKDGISGPGLDAGEASGQLARGQLHCSWGGGSGRVLPLHFTSIGWRK